MGLSQRMKRSQSRQNAAAGQGPGAAPGFLAAGVHAGRDREDQRLNSEHGNQLHIDSVARNQPKWVYGFVMSRPGENSYNKYMICLHSSDTRGISFILD